MPTLYETLAPTQRLAIATRTTGPARLAQTFAAFAGQFYDRTAFDALARQVSALYEPERADTFRAQLDRRLRDRAHAPVAWEAAPPRAERAA